VWRVLFTSVTGTVVDELRVGAQVTACEHVSPLRVVVGGSAGATSHTIARIERERVVVVEGREFA
jgi:hypothetical protein